MRFPRRFKESLIQAIESRNDVFDKEIKADHIILRNPKDPDIYISIFCEDTNKFNIKGVNAFKKEMQIQNRIGQKLSKNLIENWMKDVAFEFDLAKTKTSDKDSIEYIASVNDPDAYAEMQNSIGTRNDQQNILREIIIRFINQSQSDNLRTSSYPNQFNGFRLKVGFGQGRPANVTWVAFLNDTNTVSYGIYPVYLYFKSEDVLILAYGVSDTRKPKENWKMNALNIQDFFEENYGIKPPRYGDSFFYKSYEPNKIDFSIALSDLNEILDIYTKQNPENIDNRNAERTYRFPRLNITNNERKFLNRIYELEKEDEKWEVRNILAELWRNPPKDFDPRKIDSRLLKYGKEITLLGIWHLDPSSYLIESTENVIYEIANIIHENPKLDAVDSAIISERVDIDFDTVYLIFKLLARFDNFSKGRSYNQNEKKASLSIGEDDIYSNYLRFSGLEDLVNSQFGIIYDESKNEFVNENESNDNLRLPFETSPIIFRDRDRIDAVLGASDLANEVSSIIDDMPDEQGRIIGVFGKWGRGKTFLIDQIWKVLANKKNYLRVDFHAWKYQSTPGSWAYLYELLSKTYLGDKKNPFKHYGRRLKLNYARYGIRPILELVFAILIGGLTTVGLLRVESDLVFIGIPLISVGLFSVLRKLYNDYSSKAINLIHKYGAKKTFKETLGVQAEIQEELVKLINTWIDKSSNKKIVLIVDDIDRCEESKIIENIDSLRVMLEDKRISRMLYVIVAVDERILKRAIKWKYHNIIKLESDLSEGSKSVLANELDKLTSEYLDKIFLCGIKLGDLTEHEREEFFKELSKSDFTERVSTVADSEKIIDSEGEEPKEINEYSKTVLSDNDTNDKSSISNVPEANIKLTKRNEGSVENVEITSENSAKKLSHDEIDILMNSIKKYNDSTPRQIRILYNRYLLARNILINYYRLSKRENIWKEGHHCEIFIKLIMGYTALNNPGQITLDKIQAIDVESENVAINLIPETSVSRSDYIDLLRVLEIVIAY